MNGKEQVKLLIESLELRLEQVKANKEELDLKILIYTPCPMCEAMGLESVCDRDGDIKCQKCIADASGVCFEYANRVIVHKDRVKLLAWLRYQIKKWKKIYKQIDPLRKKLEQWKNGRLEE